MGAPRVVISGIGVVSTFGVGRECFWENVRRGVSAARARSPSSTSRPIPARWRRRSRRSRSISAQPLDGEHENGHESRADPKRYSRAALLGVIAAREAWNDAGLRVDEPGAGVIIGSGGGGIDVGEAQYRDFFTNGGRHVTPYAIAVGIVGMLSSELSISLGPARHQPRAVDGLHEFNRRARLCGAADPLGRSRRAAVRRRRWLRHAGHDLRLLAHARGVDALQRSAVGSVAALRSRDATGSSSAKAPGCTSSSARIARGRAARRIYATVEGYHSTCDAYHRVQMDPDGTEIVAAMRGAVEKSGRAVEEIGYVNYHGTSTQLNDAIEVALHAPGLRLSRGTSSGLVHQVDDRPSAGRQRRRRHRRHGAGAGPRLPAADGQPHGSGSGLRHGLPAAASAARRSRRRRSATAWASGRRTAPSCSAPVECLTM